MTKFRKVDGPEPQGEPLHYTQCGLDDVYLVNGWQRETVDGEVFTTIEDLDNLWKSIGLHLVTRKKVLAPKEIRFLRDHMDLTQAELGARLRVSDQTIARWEKGETDEIPGPADLMLRVLFLACKSAQPEGGIILDELMKLLDDLVFSDEQAKPNPVVFEHGKKKWSERPREREVAYA
jgi:DNA-binding transcriptional regulator YiaG